MDGMKRAAREVTYVAVGLGVLGFQRAQVRRRELAKVLARSTRCVMPRPRS